MRRLTGDERRVLRAALQVVAEIDDGETEFDGCFMELWDPEDNAVARDLFLRLRRPDGGREGGPVK